MADIAQPACCICNAAEAPASLQCGNGSQGPTENGDPCRSHEVGAGQNTKYSQLIALSLY